MFEMLSASTLKELRAKVDEFLKDKPNAMVEYGHIAIITDAAGDAPDNNEPTLGSVVTFAAYPDIRWVIQHIDGEDVYLATETAVRECTFGIDTIASVKYSESTLYAHCIMYLNETIPNLANCLESVTVNGVTYKVFIPSKEQLNSEWDWPSAAEANRICQYNGSNTAWWTGSSNYPRYVWYVTDDGYFDNLYSPSNVLGFRPAIRMKYETMLKLMQPHTTSKTFEPTLGQIITLEEYPNIAWEVQHIEGDYVYLLRATNAKICEFGTDANYADSVLLELCTEFLSTHIPDIGKYLEDVTINGVNTKVFVPSYEQLSSEWDWPKAAETNRICQCVGPDAAIWNCPWWTSSSYSSSRVWIVGSSGNFYGNNPSNPGGFRPAIKLNLRRYLKDHPDGLLVDTQ